MGAPQMIRTLSILALLMASAAPLAAQPSSPETVAAAALDAAPVWDGHNDVPIQLRSRFGNMINGFDFVDTTDTGQPDGSRVMHTDLARLARGKVGAQFWSVYVSGTLPEPEAVQATIEQVDVTKRLIARYPERMALAMTADEMEAAMAAGKVAGMMGAEGGHSIGSSLAVLRQLYDLGVRYMTLTHSRNTPWADSATADPEHGGLSEFGVQVVREMQRIGMLVDLSHVSEDSMNDALDVAGAPVIFSHSGARAVNAHARNVPDSVLARMKDNGGIVMAVAFPSYVSEPLRLWMADRQAEEARQKSLLQGQPAAVKAAMDVWANGHPMPLSTVSDLADHIDHIRAVAGIDHIGIGGDYDGMDSGPVGMEDVTGYPVLFTELAKRGYSQDDLEKIASRNMMRVLRAAEAYAAEHSADLPIETKVSD
jgi:membrane dipeptidase